MQSGGYGYEGKDGQRKHLMTIQESIELLFELYSEYAHQICGHNKRYFQAVAVACKALSVLNTEETESCQEETV